MRIGQIGGERGLIARLVRQARDPAVRVGPGDDAAVVKLGGDFTLLTTDTLVEGEHFSLTRFTPRQVGMKALEVNVSDIAAMGGEPRLGVVALTLPREMEVETVEAIYEGLYLVADKYRMELVGGDTTRGPLLVLTLTVLGEVSPGRLLLRSGARPGDLILVSGSLGASQAGLLLLERGIPGFDELKRRHLEPVARLDAARRLAGQVSAMEDVSDGLATEVQNICLASACGAVIKAEDVPVAADVREAARLLGQDPLDLALFGGEDYELVYTAPAARAPQLPGHVVGVITAERGARLSRGGKEEPLERSGWDPFRDP